jgi:membrane-bound inhibitor of C-type lysozyme
MIKKVLYGVALIVLMLVVILFSRQGNEISTVTDYIPVVTGQATYQCATGRTITAVFTEIGPMPDVLPGQPPVSNASVTLSLDGSPSITLPQAISADGSRYANVEESLVFWSKGSGAMVLENGEEINYINCISVKEDSGNLPLVYLDEFNRFTLRYPTGFVADEFYTYKNFGADSPVPGVKFTIPDNLTSGTNLSKDSYISVENLTGAKSCQAQTFLVNGSDLKSEVVEEAGFTYSLMTSSEAAAGNRYDEYVYALTDTNPCLAIRYFVHYSAIENYDAGTVVAFDKEALLTQFDEIRRSLTLDARFSQVSTLSADVYPLYKGVMWQSEKDGEYDSSLKGYKLQSNPLLNITDISAVTLPFEKYYAGLLTSRGWKEDLSMSAGGPGSAVIAYNKGDEYIILQYTSSFGVNKEDEPAQCPCGVTFTIFTGSRQ